MLKKSLPPLAHRLRPQDLSEFVGQQHLLGEKGFVGLMLARGHLAAVKQLWRFYLPVPSRQIFTGFLP